MLWRRWHVGSGRSRGSSLRPVMATVVLAALVRAERGAGHGVRVSLGRGLSGHTPRLRGGGVRRTAVACAVCMTVVLGASVFPNVFARRSNAVRGTAAARVGRLWSFSRAAPLNRADLARSGRREAARERWLESPQVRARRVASRMAFHDLSAIQARRLDEHVYGAELAAASANPAAGVAAAGRLVRYLGNDVALVRTPGGSLEREVSTVPLRVAHGAGGEQPVDLALRRTGEAYVPANPLRSVSIAQRSGAGVALGSSAMRIVPAGADVGSVLIGASSVLYPKIGLDEDASATPTTDGVQLSTVLRSQASPEQISYQVYLPAGAVLRRSGGGAVISDGSTTVHVLSPFARDAQGQSVPVQMTVEGDQLILHVAHRNLDVAYPLFVDPTVTIEHCCGEWESNGKWETGYYDKEIEKEERFNGSTPGVMEAAPGWYGPPKAEEDVIQGWGNEWAEERGWFDTKMTFYGVEFANAGDTAGIIYASVGGLCQHDELSQDYSWNSYENGPPPSTLTFPSREEYAKDYFKWCSPDGFGMTMGERPEPPPPPSGCEGYSCKTTATVRFSVGSVLLTERSFPTLTHHRRRGLRHREAFGLNNPAEPDQLRVCEGEPVECATGNEIETQTDLNIPGRGVPLELTRTYNSQAAVAQSEPGPFGYGWSASFGDHLKIGKYGGATTVEQANGSDVVFQGNPNAEVELTASPWVQAKLVPIYNEGWEYKYTLPNQETLRFNANGVLTSETDRNGNTTTISHNAEGHIESVTDASGRKLSFKYNGSGEVESIKDPMGHTVKYTYEGGNLTSVTEPGETTPRWQFKYDSAHELTKMIDGRGGYTTNEYNSSHQVVLQTDPVGRKLHFEYEELKVKRAANMRSRRRGRKPLKKKARKKQAPKNFQGV